MESTTIIKQPFSNLQLELLKLYSSNISEDDLIKIKEILAHFFFEKAKDAADKAWDEKGLNEEKLLKKHRRRPYHPEHP